jgi:hypothetical protein
MTFEEIEQYLIPEYCVQRDHDEQRSINANATSLLQFPRSVDVEIYH